MLKLIGFFLAVQLTTFAQAQELRVESGLVDFSRNDIRITGDSGDNLNTKDFSQDSTVGYRIYYKHNFDTSFIQLLYAPLETSFGGNFNAPKNFDGYSFSAGPAAINYKFNSYRLTYGREFLKNEKWLLNYGVVGKIRDAFIEVSQNGVTKRSSNVGFVPLLHFSGHYLISENYRFLFDLEALAAPQGRAIDMGLFGAYKINPTAELLIGYRVIEGGADNDKVYNFSLINQYSLGINWKF